MATLYGVSVSRQFVHSILISTFFLLLTPVLTLAAEDAEDEVLSEVTVGATRLTQVDVDKAGVDSAANSSRVTQLSQAGANTDLDDVVLLEEVFVTGTQI